MNNACQNQCCNRRFCCNNSQNCCNNNTIPIPGPRGPKGEAATIAIGTTTTGDVGSNASVTNSGTTNNAVLNFKIPRGATGQAGTPATIAIGTTTTLPPGSNATVTNIGTPSNAILNFGIPSGSSSQTNIDSGNFISRLFQTFNNPNSIIQLPTTLNSTRININDNSVITLSKSGRYLINYGIKSTTIGNIIGMYINGINNQNTNLETIISDLNPSSSIILDLQQSDTITLGAVNASTSNPLTLQSNTINAYITIICLD